MPNDESIVSQQALLATYRQTLAHLVQQAALHGGEPFAPPATANGIAEARANIARIKVELRALGIVVADEPNDIAPPLVDPIAPFTSESIRTIDTGGGDYAERDIDKRQGAFVEGGVVHGLVVGENKGIINYYPPSSSSLTPQQRRNRSAMLTKVRVIWIVGLLDQSLANELRIALDLTAQPDAVNLPLNALVQELNRPSYDLPAGTPVITVFEQMGGALLILGAPGAGKTTLLLELARDLIARAEQDESHPIPVVFNLSSWATKRQPLKEWLVEELNTKYDVPRKLAQEWTDTDALLPLLDGLDEVAAEQRSACAEAINTYRQEHGLVPLAVCSRMLDYEALTIKLRLQGAVVVQPLTSQQVDTYLEQAGAKLAGVRTALHDDTELREMLDTPLMLSIVALAYSDKPFTELQSQGTPDERRQHLFDDYVTQMFARRQTGRYRAEQTMRWLGWLAHALEDHAQRMLLLERLQPDWLPPAQRRWYTVGVSLLGGVIYGVVLLVAYAIATGLALGLVAGLIDGLVAGLMVGAILGVPQIRQQFQRRSWRSTGISVALGVGIATLVGSVIGLSSSGFPQVVAPIQQYQLFAASPQLMGLIAGLFISLQTGLAMGVIMAVVPSLEQITYVEAIRWSWTNIRLSDWGRILPVLAGGLVVAVALGVMALLAGAWQFGIASALTVFASTIVGALIVTGSTINVVETKTVPNQGMRRSAWHALVIGGMCGLCAGSIAGVMQRLLGEDALTSVRVGISVLLGYAAMVGLVYGGLACFQHAVVRWLLWRSGAAPLRYAAFLDDCTGRIFLHRIGGGWIFVHRLLLEYFADQYEKSQEAR